MGVRGVVGTVLVAGASLLVSCGDRAREQRPAAFKSLSVGDVAPPYEVRTLDGDTVRIAANEPVTILNVWATWCESCREEMSDLNALDREFQGKHVRVVGVSVDASPDYRVRRFAEAAKLTFLVGHDPQQRIQQLYNVVGVPETFVVGSDGRVVWLRVGNLHPALDSLRAVVHRAIRVE